MGSIEPSLPSCASSTAASQSIEPSMQQSHISRPYESHMHETIIPPPYISKRKKMYFLPRRTFSHDDTILYRTNGAGSPGAYYYYYYYYWYMRAIFTGPHVWGSLSLPLSWWLCVHSHERRKKYLFLVVYINMNSWVPCVYVLLCELLSPPRSPWSITHSVFTLVLYMRRPHFLLRGL